MSDVEVKLEQFRRNDRLGRILMVLAIVGGLAISAGAGFGFVLWERSQQAELLTPPANWNEERYLERYPDVRQLVERGRFESGWHHFLANGINENRKAPGLE